MRAIGIHQARAPLGVPEQDEVFAENLHADRVTVGSGNFLGEGYWEPEASKELAHGCTRAGSTDKFVFLARQHVAPPSQVCQLCGASQRRSNESPMPRKCLRNASSCQAGVAQLQSSFVARRAPCASASNFAHTTLGWLSGSRRACAEKPQSAPAITRSRPTARAKRTMRSPISSGCSTRFVV